MYVHCGPETILNHHYIMTWKHLKKYCPMCAGNPSIATKLSAKGQIISSIWYVCEDTNTEHSSGLNAIHCGDFSSPRFDIEMSLLVTFIPNSHGQFEMKYVSFNGLTSLALENFTLLKCFKMLLFKSDLTKSTCTRVSGNFLNCPIFFSGRLCSGWFRIHLVGLGLRTVTVW